MSPTDAGLMSIAHGRRAARLQHRHRPDHHPHRASGSAGWSAAWSLVDRRPRPCSARSTRPPPCAVVGVFMAVLGLGLGATMQNLVLAVQNNTAQADMGAASSRGRVLPLASAARSASRRSGAVLSHQVADEGRRRAWRSDRASSTDGHAEPARIPDLTTLPAPVRGALRAAPSATPPATSSWSPCRSRSLALVVRAVHPRGAAAHHDRPRRTRSAAGGRQSRDRGARR